MAKRSTWNSTSMAALVADSSSISVSRSGAAGLGSARLAASSAAQIAAASSSWARATAVSGQIPDVAPTATAPSAAASRR